MNKKILFGLLLVALFIIGCKEDIIPKPKALLRLDYPQVEMGKFQTEHFAFQYNKISKLKSQNKNSVELDYPMMKGSIFINYRKIENNFEKLLSDARRFSYEHAAKADGISEQPFVNPKNKVYGMFYEVIGDAASQAQFYATDSTEHFVTGSLYFYARPNYDSIYPAAVYLQNDIRMIMESLRWKQ